MWLKCVCVSIVYLSCNQLFWTEFHFRHSDYMQINLGPSSVGCRTVGAHLYGYAQTIIQRFCSNVIESGRLQFNGRFVAKSELYICVAFCWNCLYFVFKYGLTKSRRGDPSLRQISHFFRVTPIKERTLLNLIIKIETSNFVNFFDCKPRFTTHIINNHIGFSILFMHTLISCFQWGACNIESRIPYGSSTYHFVF